MRREEVVARLAQHRDELTALGVKSLALFGSTARGEARPESDVDLLIDLDRPMGLFGLARIQRQLEAWIGGRVDLVPRDSIKPAFRDAILREAVRAA